MLSRKIELSVNDMAEALEFAKQQKLEIAFDKISCNDGCSARILYKNTWRDREALLKLLPEIHALELAQIRRLQPLNLHLLKSIKQRV
ncbi:MAG: hypothetical protein H0W73_04950 [Bacteroidetes bacterium]|nr:hypothetical protein [Bacteroidota bacterium]